MKLTILGSGSPEAYARRASSGYLVEVGQDTLLFDCGGGVFDSLLRSGRTPSDITHLFFSHLHSDHMMDYARLVHAAWDEGAPPLQVYGPVPIARITAGYFGPDGVLAHDLRARTELLPSQEVWKARGGTVPRPWPAPIVTEIPTDATVSGDGWELTACEVPHAQPVLPCMGFRLRASGRSFVYSGDAGHSEALNALAHSADLLLHWCYRLDGENTHRAMQALTPPPADIAHMARDAQVGRLLLTHFRVHMDTPKAHAAALTTMRDIFGPECAIVEDLDTYEI